MRAVGWLLVAGLVAGQAGAQRRPRLQSLRDEPAVVAAFAEVVAVADRFVVAVRVDGVRKALGTVVGADGAVVTKASELGGGGGEGAERPAVEVVIGEVAHAARVVGVDAETDLALLRVDGVARLEAAAWAEAVPRAGAWLVSPDGDGTPAGIGVASAAPYRHSRDRGYLGVQLHSTPSPVRLMTVHEDTAAAEAGLRADDEVLAVDGEAVGASPAFIRAVQARKPGEDIVLRVRRGEDELDVRATLRRDRRGARSDQEPLWGPLSEVRAGFATVLQHDTVLTPDACGGPLVDLDGRVVGVNIARAGRVETLALPAADVRAAIARIEG